MALGRTQLLPEIPSNCSRPLHLARRCAFRRLPVPRGQTIGHGAIEELVMMMELTTNGALGIPRGLVSTCALVVVEAILGTHHNHSSLRHILRSNQAAPTIRYGSQQELFVEVV